MAGAVINLIFFIAFLLLSVYLSKGKGGFLIAGYNTLSDEEKSQYDEVALCKCVGKIMYGVSFSILLWSLSEFFQIQALFIIGLIFFFLFVFGGLIYVNTGNRFKINPDDKTNSTSHND